MPVSPVLHMHLNCSCGGVLKIGVPPNHPSSISILKHIKTHCFGDPRFLRPILRNLRVNTSIVHVGFSFLKGVAPTHPFIDGLPIRSIYFHGFFP